MWLKKSETKINGSSNQQVTEWADASYEELDHFGLLSAPSPKVSATDVPQKSVPEVVHYDSLFDLRDQWKRLDHSESAWRLTVILVLPDDFEGHLAGLIRRRHPALRLLISSPESPVSGMLTMSDLALQSASLGWHLISFHRNADEAVAGGVKPLTWHERCVLFCPAETQLAGVGASTGSAPQWETRWL